MICSIPRGRSRRAVGTRWLAVCCAASVALGAWVASAPVAAAEPASSSRPTEKFYETRPLGRIAPGTRIADQPPEGWTHLILKSQPRVTTGDIDGVPAIAVRLSSLLFTAVVAKVAAQPVDGSQQFVLESCAVGVGTNIQGADVIVTSATQQQLGANLGLLPSAVLQQTEQSLSQYVEVARSPTMCVLDCPSVIVRGDQHETVTLRQAVIVDPRNGQLFSVFWFLDKDPARPERLLGGECHLMASNLVYDCQMRVDRDEFTLGIPGPEAFAMVALPANRPVPLTSELKAVAGAARFTPTTTYQLEVALWNALYQPAR